MASPTFEYPAGGPYTTTLTFKDGALVNRTAQEEPIQFRRMSESGVAFVYEYNSNTELFLPVEVSDLQEVDADGFSGYNSLRSFFQNTTTWAVNAFDYTDADQVLTTVQYWGGFRSLRESTRQKVWTGELLFYRKI